MGVEFIAQQLSVPADLYNEQYYRYYNRGFGEFKAGSIHPIFKKAIRLAELLNKNKILDIGCGRGEIIYLCALHGCQASGIDYSESAVNMARNFLDNNLPKTLSHSANVELMDAKNLKYESSSFDAVFMLDIVEHLYDGELEKVLAEASRVLKPSGKLIVHTDPNWFIMGPVRFLSGLIGINLKSKKFHINEQSIFSLKKHLNRTFSVKKIYLEKDKNYWTNATPERGIVIKITARIIDWCLDNYVSDFIIRKSFINIFLGTNIWAISTPKKK
jgi:SAM-dependent methyltransferase